MQCDCFFPEKKVRKDSLFRKSREADEIERVRVRMKLKLCREKRDYLTLKEM